MEKVKLRPFRLEDAPRLTELANNIKIAENLRDGFPHPYSLADAKNFIKMCLNKNPTQAFAIEYNGEYVGNIGVHPEKDVYRKSAEIGYFLGEPFWGKGIMTEAVKLLVEYNFENLDIVRIHTGIFEYNVASQRVLESVALKKRSFLKKPSSKIINFGTR